MCPHAGYCFSWQRAPALPACRQAGNQLSYGTAGAKIKIDFLPATTDAKKIRKNQISDHRNVIRKFMEKFHKVTTPVAITLEI
jgi:hypothetical protein